MTKLEQLTAAYGKLMEAATLLEAAGWPGLAEEAAELANAVDAAASALAPSSRAARRC